MKNMINVYDFNIDKNIEIYENQELYNELESLDISDELFYSLIDKHKNKELTYLEVMEILNKNS